MVGSEGVCSSCKQALNSSLHPRPLLLHWLFPFLLCQPPLATSVQQSLSPVIIWSRGSPAAPTILVENVTACMTPLCSHSS